jgi:capsular exopolysaccharide synthesis family protein
MFRRSQSSSNFASSAGSPEMRSTGIPRSPVEPLSEAIACGQDLLGVPQFLMPEDPECRLVAINDQASAGAERFSTLVSRLRYAQQRHALSKLLVTSAVPGDGKTLISINLAITLAVHQRRTLVIDGDLRKPSVTAVLKINNDKGLIDWWKRREPVTMNMVRAKQIPLWVLPAGRGIDKPATLLESSEFAELLDQLSSRFDWVIIDSPPLVPFADAATLATLSDAVVLVTRRACTPANILRDAVKSLDTKKIIANVLNDSPVTDHKYYQYYYQKAR